MLEIDLKLQYNQKMKYSLYICCEAKKISQKASFELLLKSTTKIIFIIFNKIKCVQFKFKKLLKIYF